MSAVARMSSSGLRVRHQEIRQLSRLDRSDVLQLHPEETGAVQACHGRDSKRPRRSSAPRLREPSPRGDEQSEPLEELERSERESGGTIRCGMRETIDDALASRRTVPVSLEPFEGEGRTGTVAQESFEPGTVTGRDVTCSAMRSGDRRQSATSSQILKKFPPITLPTSSSVYP